jgi:hypothetical protein
MRVVASPGTIGFFHRQLPGNAYVAGTMGPLRISSTGRLSWGDLLLGLALFAAIVRSLIPDGFMPAVHDGQVSMVICTADGATTIDGTERPGTGLDGVMAGAHAPCAFAGLAVIAPPPSAPIVSLNFAIVEGLVEIDDANGQFRETSYRPQAQRAPPSFQA